MPPSHGSKRQRTVGNANAVRSQKKRKLCKCVECCAELACGVRWLEREYYRHQSQSRAPSAAAAADDGPDDDHGGGGHESDEWCSDAGELASGEDLGSDEEFAGDIDALAEDESMDADDAAEGPLIEDSELPDVGASDEELLVGEADEGLGRAVSPPALIESDEEGFGERREDVEDEVAPPAALELPAAAEAVRNLGGRPRLDPLSNLSAPLWPAGIAAATTTVGQLLTDFFTNSDAHNKTDRASRGDFDLYRRHFPNGSALPSWDQACTLLMRASPVKSKHYVVCTSDCMIVEPSLEDSSPEEIRLLKLASCDFCALAFADEKGRFNRKFIYIGITERLRMMLEDPTLGPYMRLPWPGASVEPTAEEVAAGGYSAPVEPTLDGDCRNLYQSVGWWKGVQEEKGPDGGREWRHQGCNIALALNVDGVQPFKRGQRTMTPIALMVLNLPENLRHRPEYLLLAGIIAKQEPKNLNPYLGFLVRELLTLYDAPLQPGGGADAEHPPAAKGVAFTDPRTKLVRVAKVKLLFTASDYVAHTKINRQQTHGHTHGCHKCDVPSESQQGSMRFLGLDELSDGVRPLELTMREYLRRAALCKAAHAAYERDRAVPGAKAVRERSLREAKNVMDRSVLADLPYFDVPQHTLLDMMHNVQGLMYRIFLPLMTGGRLKAYAKATGVCAVVKPKKPVYRFLPSPREVRPRERALAAYTKALAKYIASKKKAKAEGALAGFYNRFAVSEQRLLLGERAYRLVQAPLNIAPLTKKPLTLGSEMTAHQWVNFVKVYGKYLIYIVYHQPADEEYDSLVLAMRGFKALMHLMTLCLSSNATAQVKADTATAVVRLAGAFKVYFPSTQQVLNLHTLLFHMPGIIRMWGPSRGYWCFAFERFIGLLKRMVKSRKNPEENVANRYIRGVATRSVGFAAAEAERDLEDDAPDPVDPHPLIHNDARNSMVDSRKVVWPQRLTPGNSGPSGLPPCSELHVRSRVMTRILGAAVCDLYPRIAPGRYAMRAVFCKVQRGPWRFSLEEREEVVEANEEEDEDGRLNRQKGNVRSSWFKIHASRVPHYVRDPLLGPAVAAHDGEYLYGRIRRFAQLDVPAWREEPFRLAKVRLFEASQHVNEMGLTIIDTKAPLQFMFEGRLESIEYVQVQDLAACIAVGPCLVGPAPSSLFFVLPIDL